MPQKKFCATFLDTVKSAPKGKVIDYTDPGSTGLILRVTDRGTKTWRLVYRVAGEGGTGPKGHSKQGKTKIMVLGRYPMVSLKVARRKAEEAWDKAREGEDPKGARHDAIMARREIEATTFGAVAVEYIAAAECGEIVGTKRRSLSEGVIQRRRHDLAMHLLPKLRDRPLMDITFFELDDLIKKLKKNSKRTVPGRVIESVKAVYQYAVKNRKLSRRDNIAADLTDDAPTVENDRVLDRDEIRLLWKATKRMGVFGAFIQVLLLTAQRRGEVAAMSWADLDLEKGVWRLPGKKTKARRVHEIPLSGPVLEIIKAQEIGGDLVFPTTKGGVMAGWSKLKPNLDREMKSLRIGLSEADRVMLVKKGLPYCERPLRQAIKDRLEEVPFEPFKLHDLRRTAATEMATSELDEDGDIITQGVSPLVISLILNHAADMGVTGIYNRYNFAAEMKLALNQWAQTVVEIVPSGDVVVELRRSA